VSRTVAAVVKQARSQRRSLFSPAQRDQRHPRRVENRLNPYAASTLMVLSLLKELKPGGGDSIFLRHKITPIKASN
jgi:hypothetical protein